MKKSIFNTLCKVLLGEDVADIPQLEFNKLLKWGHKKAKKFGYDDLTHAYVMSDGPDDEQEEEEKIPVTISTEEAGASVSFLTRDEVKKLIESLEASLGPTEEEEENHRRVAWMEKYCEEHGLTSAHDKNWERAERAWEKKKMQN